jgi:hypothetical protein
LPSSPSSSSPSSPQLQQESLSPEQFWAKYRRGGGGGGVAESRKFRSLFSALSLSDTTSSAMLAEPVASHPEEPLYSEIYGAVARPPLPRKNSVSKPPARPPLPADKQRVQSGRPAVVSREVAAKGKVSARP